MESVKPWQINPGVPTAKPSRSELPQLDSGAEMQDLATPYTGFLTVS